MAHELQQTVRTYGTGRVEAPRLRRSVRNETQNSERRKPLRCSAVRDAYTRTTYTSTFNLHSNPAREVI